MLIVDGTLVPTRDHTVADQSKNYRYSTNHQVVIDADPRLAVVVGRPLAGNRNDCKAWEESGAKAAVGRTTTIADGGYPGTGLDVVCDNVAQVVAQFVVAAVLGPGRPPRLVTVIFIEL